MRKIYMLRVVVCPEAESTSTNATFKTARVEEGEIL